MKCFWSFIACLIVSVALVDRPSLSAEPPRTSAEVEKGYRRVVGRVARLAFRPGIGKYDLLIEPTSPVNCEFRLEFNKKDPDYLCQWEGKAVTQEELMLKFMETIPENKEIWVELFTAPNFDLTSRTRFKIVDKR